MPVNILLFILLLSIRAGATTYLVRNGGSGDGRSGKTALGYDQLPGLRLAAGDTVLLKRGDVFFGELPVSSGVHYGAWGNGANPVVSGLQTVTGWRSYAGRVFVAPFGAAAVGMVLLNRAPVAMGRFPNSGYLPYTGHSGSRSISGPAIAVLPFPAAGAGAVVRKERWILDRHWVTAHNGDRLQFGAGSPDGGYHDRHGVDGNGFFIQNHLQTLDKTGEWWYDKAGQRLFMVLDNAAQVVQAAVVPKLVNIGARAGISFAQIDFEGSTGQAIAMDGSRDISFTGCRFRFHGQTGIYGIRTRGLTVVNSVVQHCRNNGIWVEWQGRNTLLQNLLVADCGTLAGAGRSGDAAQQGISISGDSTVIRGCRVVRTGYNGIHFSGSHVVVEKNTVDSFCLVKDDGAGIYNYENEGVKAVNRQVRRNTVLHAVGAFAGAESYDYEAHGKAAGIYLDGNSQNTVVADNVIGHGPWAGFFVNNTGQARFSGNLVYGHQISILLIESQAGRVRGLEVNGNRLMGKKPLYLRLYAADEPELFGRFEQNSFAASDSVWIDRQFSGGGLQRIRLDRLRKRAARTDGRMRRN